MKKQKNITYGFTNASISLQNQLDIINEAIENLYNKPDKLNVLPHSIPNNIIVQRYPDNKYKMYSTIYNESYNKIYNI